MGKNWGVEGIDEVARLVGKLQRLVVGLFEDRGLRLGDGCGSRSAAGPRRRSPDAVRRRRMTPKIAGFPSVLVNQSTGCDSNGGAAESKIFALATP